MHRRRGGGPTKSLTKPHHQELHHHYHLDDRDEKQASQGGEHHDGGASYKFSYLLSRRWRSVVAVTAITLFVVFSSFFRRCHYYYHHPVRAGGNGSVKNLLQSSLLQKLAAQRVVVSIGTVTSRQDPLLRTLESIIVHQDVAPGRVQIHYTDERYPVLAMKKRASAVLGLSSTTAAEGGGGPQLSFHRSPEKWKTAQKLLGALYQEWNGTIPPPNHHHHHRDQEESLIVLADDDFLYSRRWLESLLVGHLQLPEAAVALRGWRVRHDLRYGAPPLTPGAADGVWGSFPAVERYVIQGDRLCEPYQVGVLVGCNGVLLRPSYFGPEIFAAPTETHFLLNDVWNAGNLANHSIERWVVPMLGSESVGVHLGQHATVIDSQIKGTTTSSSRGIGNTMMLRYFSDKWEKNLWWSPDDAPPLRGFLSFRHWFSEHIILGLHSVGWIRRAVGDWKVVDE